MTTDSQVTLEDVFKSIEGNSEEIARVHRRLDEFVESEEFSEAVGSIVEAKVTKVFDNHMSDIKKMFAQIGKALSDLGQEEKG